MTTLLLPITSSDEHYDECNFVVVHIGKEALALIGKRVTAACKIKSTDKSLLKLCFWSSIQFYGINEKQLEAIKRECTYLIFGNIIALGEGSKPALGIHVRTDCEQLCVWPSEFRSSNTTDVSWCAYDHYTSTRLESDRLCFQALSNLVTSQQLKMPGTKKNKRK